MKSYSYIICYILRFLIPALLCLTAIGCKREEVIDPTHPWPTSGVPEADSLLLDIERLTIDNGSFNVRISEQKRLIQEFYKIAERHPDNKRLAIRKLFCEIMDINMKNPDVVKPLTDSALLMTDSALYPYEYHRFLTISIENEPDYIKKYNSAIANIAFFSDRKSPVALGKNLIIAGNVMYHLSDTLRALEYAERAEKIFRELDFKHGIRVALNNKAIVTKDREKIYRTILLDSTINDDPYSQVLVLHNLFFDTDSVELLEKTIDIFNSFDIDHTNFPLTLGLLGQYYVVHGEPQKGLEYLNMAIDTTRKYAPDNMGYYMDFNNFQADAYYFLNNKNSCIEALARAREFTYLYMKQTFRAKIYSTDAAARIRLAEKNASLEKQREIAAVVIGFLILTIILLWLIFRMRRRQAEKMHEEALMQERHERNLQSIRAQSKVMEESDRMIESIEEKIDEMKTSSKLSEESAENLNRILRLHKSNEENRQGFLKVQQELDTRFIENLKRDFPTLPETQIKLASLIAAGLDSRQIGNIMNIEQASVHKSRYRLRTRLGLSKDQSLDDFLRAYNRPLP
ncbi:MAG: hypothetical protein K2H60_05120 [Muribaculaceae bacterium]|nr:hypothetical protein [Muribaculaceae bacterium]